MIVVATSLLIIVGQWHWNVQASKMAIHAEQQLVSLNKKDITFYDQMTTDRQRYLEIAFVYEEKFVEVLSLYQEKVHQLKAEAEIDFYKNNWLFRDFLSFYIEELEELVLKSEEEYQEINDAFTIALINTGYHFTDNIFYNLIFEEVVTETRLAFVTYLLSLQS